MVVLFDFKKAIDVVDHDILCQKLYVYGFCDKNCTFFSNHIYLKEHNKYALVIYFPKKAV